MTTRQRTRAARWGGALLLAVAPLPWLGVGAAAATQGDQTSEAAKITICHRTNSVSNPYVVITVDTSAADGDLGNNNGQGDHYAEHLGPVFDPDADYQPPFNGDDWGDIIPPIAGVHLGLNWTDAGQAIWKSDCAPVKPQPNPSETVTTPQPSASETVTTPGPSASETVTTPQPSASETVTTPGPSASGSSSAEVSPSESTSPEVSPSESTSPEVSPSESSSSPGPTITESSSQPEVSPTEDTSVKPNRSEKPGVLPQTGSELPIGSALVASMLMIVLGALLLMGPGRLAAERYHRRH